MYYPHIDREKGESSMKQFSRNSMMMQMCMCMCMFSCAQNSHLLSQNA